MPTAQAEPRSLHFSMHIVLQCRREPGSRRKDTHSFMFFPLFINIFFSISLLEAYEEQQIHLSQRLKISPPFAGPLLLCKKSKGFLSDVGDERALLRKRRGFLPSVLSGTENEGYWVNRALGGLNTYWS